MKKALVIIDMQKDFVDGALGTDEAKKIVPNAVKFIQDVRNDKDYKIITTYDTHRKDYLDTLEGKKLPVPHCIAYSEGWMLNKEIRKTLENKLCTTFEKPTFGEPKLAEYIKNEEFNEVTIIGLVTSICVISNALLIRAFNPNLIIKVKADCCAGITKEDHDAALTVMKMCQIDII